MATEINFARLSIPLPELRSALSENRRMILIPAAAALLGYHILHDPIKEGLERFFAYFYTSFCLKDVNQALRQFREQTKSELASQKVRDPHPHNDDTLRILEIGMGPGASLDFYPKSSRVMAVEPNPYFVDQLLELQKSNPNLVKVIRGYAEDLSDVCDESVDAVVSTMVLCSVHDLDKSIKEVKRVLVKGGRFYFFEHEACQTSWKRYLLQLAISPIWRLMFFGCRLCRQTHRQLELNGFEMSHVKQETGKMLYIVQSQTSGYAVKP